MLQRLNVGDRFMLTDAALENYGEEYRGKVFTVRSWANRYVPAKEYFAKPIAHPHGHPGYDESVSPQRLYEANGLNVAVYDWEVKRA